MRLTSITKKKRKAQYYMFGAIIFMAGVFAIFYSKSGITVKRLDDIKDVWENYLYEGTNVLNSAVYYKANVSEAMRNYTESFIEYKASEIPGLGIVYMFSRENEIHVINYIPENIELEGEGSLAYTQEKVMVFQETVGIKYSNETYSYYFDSPDKIELKVMLVAKQ
jgi:hypothetical protein